MPSGEMLQIRGGGGYFKTTFFSRVFLIVVPDKRSNSRHSFLCQLRPTPGCLFAFITAPGLKQELERIGDHVPSTKALTSSQTGANRISAKTPEAFP